jgi:predicted metal-binding membrane protein
MAVQVQTRAELLLRKDRLVIASCLLIMCLLSWYYLLTGAGTGMSAVAMTSLEFPLPVHSSSAATWSASYWLIMLVMWWVMMIAMMVPSAAPAVLLYARVRRHNLARGGDVSGGVHTAAFVAGYLLAWLAFSLAATLLQWLLEQLGLVHAMLMWSTSHQLSGVLLLAAGLYQWSPVKAACLRLCRSPASFFAGRWRTDGPGALRMGLEHGLYCVGCCWVLMLLLFVGGTMNLAWIAGLTVLVLLEKLLPRGELIARLSGVLMIFSGCFLLLG